MITWNYFTHPTGNPGKNDISYSAYIALDGHGKACLSFETKRELDTVQKTISENAELNACFTADKSDFVDELEAHRVLERLLNRTIKMKSD